MPRARKDAKCLNCCIERSIYEQFEAYCEKMGQTKTLALERILKAYLEKHSKITHASGEEPIDD